MRRALLPSLLLLLAAPAAAQFGAGAGIGPDFAGERSTESASVERATSTPLALALSLSYDSSTWARIGVSTSAPAADLGRFIARGFYKLELIEMIHIAEGSGKTLSYLSTRREKGEALRRIAESLSLDFDALYDQAVQEERLVSSRLEGLWRVSPLAKPRSPGGKL